MTNTPLQQAQQVLAEAMALNTQAQALSTQAAKVVADTGALVTMLIQQHAPPPPPPPPPSPSVNFGAKTLKGLGEAPLGYGGAGTLTITAGNTGSIWAINSRNNLVAAGTFGAAAPAYAGPYSLTISDGVGFSETVTVNIVQNAWHIAWVASGTNADSPSGTNQINTILTSALLALGDTIYMRSGSYNPTCARLVTSTNPPTGVWTGSNPVVMTSEVTGSTNQGSRSVDQNLVPWTVGGQAVVGYIEIVATGAQYLRFTNVTFNNANPLNGDPQTFVPNGIVLNGAVTFITIDHNFFTGNQGLLLSGTYNTAAFTNAPTNGPGGGIFMTAVGTNNITITNNEFFGLGFGCQFRGNSSTIVGNVFHQCWYDTTDVEEAYNMNVSWNFSYDRGYDPTGAIHGDQLQFFQSALASGTYAGHTIIGNIFVDGVYPGHALPTPQGFFMEQDVSATWTGTLVKGNIYVGCTVWGIGISGQTNPKVQFNSLLFDQVLSASGPTGAANPGIRAVQGNTGGNYDYNAVTAASVFTGFTPTSHVGEIVLNPATGYTAAFTNPSAALSTLNSVPGVLAAYAAKSGGTLDPAISGLAFWCGADHYVNYAARTTSFPI